MSSGGGPGLQSRVGGNDLVLGGFDSHPFRLFHRLKPALSILNTLYLLKDDS